MKICQEDKRLIRRYLIWCYKTLKEELDRIDRKFTQLEVDDKVLKYLCAQRSPVKKGDKTYHKLLDDFKTYIRRKEESSLGLKFVDGKKGPLEPRYQFLRDRLDAVEKAIVYFLSRKELKKIQGLYDAEMIKRILEAREHP